MASLADAVGFLATSAGTVDFVVSGAVTGYQAPATGGMVNGKTYRYRAQSSPVASEWAVGYGVWNSGTSTLTRATEMYNSAGTQPSKLSFTAAPQVFIVAVSADLLQFDDAMSLTSAQQNQARLNIGFPAVNRGHIDGYQHVFTTASTTYTLGAGAANDSTNVDSILLTSSIAKTTTAWAAGTGNGGLDTGSLAGLTWYYSFVIKNPTTGAIDALFSLSPTAPTLPSGYTRFRRVGAMKTNGSGQWLKYIQAGDHWWMDVPVSDISGTAISTTSTLFTLASIPSAILITAKYNLNLYASAGTQLVCLITSPLVSTQAANSPAGNYSVIAPGNTSFGQVMDSVMTANGQVRIVSDGPGSIYLVSTGWIDTRGKDS